MEDKSFVLNKDYIVYIRCYTFNHSGFISATLKGFSSQRTHFPFACVIVDDCSSDGEQEVIKEWMKDECDVESTEFFDMELAQLYFTKHKGNPNCHFAFYLLKQNLYEDERKRVLMEEWRSHALYEAICEGDDYWTDQSKLQNQVDFLDSHKIYSAVSSNALILRSGSSPIQSFGLSKSRDYYELKEILPQRQFHSASVVFRISSMLNSPFYKKGRWDTFMWCCLLTQGPIHYDGKVTSVYRKQQQGVTSTTSRIKWLIQASKWADINCECFVPQYVSRKYVVRSVTRDIIRTFFMNGIKIPFDDKCILWTLYYHNFSIWNIFFDLREVIIQCIKKIAGRKPY